MELFSPHFSLRNSIISLRPSVTEDINALYRIADPAIWQHMSSKVNSREQLEYALLTAIAAKESQQQLQLTIIHQPTNTMIGTTSFTNIHFSNYRIEIGATWLGIEFQGRGFNPIIKFLMLQYLFETAGFERVEFRTRGTNIPSQKALAKIGATREGTLRHYFIENGVYHDVVYYSILSNEWPMIKETIFMKEKDL